jgi:cytochrome c oxidase subunit 1
MMSLLAGTFYWFPKMSGRMLDEKLGKVIFWLVFSGMNVTFLPMHWLGIAGMARRVYTYRPEFEFWNQVASFGYLLLFAGGMLLLYSIFKALRSGERAPNDPWNAYPLQKTLDWAVTSPPPPENFAKVPEIV